MLHRIRETEKEEKGIELSVAELILQDISFWLSQIAVALDLRCGKSVQYPGMESFFSSLGTVL